MKKEEYTASHKTDKSITTITVKKNGEPYYMLTLKDLYIDNDNFPEIIFTPDGKYVVICAYYDNPTYVFDLGKKEMYWEFEGKDVETFEVKGDRILISENIDDRRDYQRKIVYDIASKTVTREKRVAVKS